MKKVLLRVFDVACVLFVLWILVSWYDIASDNYLPGAIHSAHNIFNFLL